MLSDGDGNVRQTIDSSGNVGIGVTPSAWATITPALQLPNGNYIGSQGSVDTFYVGQNHFYDGTNFKYVITGYATQYQLGNDNGTHQWKISPSGTAGNNITFTTAMTLDASGNLILGSIVNYAVNGTSAAAKQFMASSSSSGFTVMRYNGFGTYGAVVNLATSAGASLGTYAGAVNNSGLGSIWFGGDNGTNYNGQGAVIYAAASETWSASTTAASLIFATTPTGATATTEKMRIDSSGNVSIATGNLTFSSTGQRITGDFSNATVANRVIFQTSTTNSATTLTAIPNGASGTAQLQVQNSSSDLVNFSYGLFRVDSSVVQVRSDIGGTGTYLPITFYTGGSERARIDTSGNVQVQAGAVMPYAPAPASISTTATLTNANIQAQIINTTGTSYTVTMPLGSTMETLATWATTNISYDFYVINTASGTITIGANSNTTLGSLTIATGVSAQFRIRRTAANAFTIYRLG